MKQLCRCCKKTLPSADATPSNPRPWQWNVCADSGTYRRPSAQAQQHLPASSCFKSMGATDDALHTSQESHFDIIHRPFPMAWARPGVYLPSDYWAGENPTVNHLGFIAHKAHKSGVWTGSLIQGLHLQETDSRICLPKPQKTVFVFFFNGVGPKLKSNILSNRLQHAQILGFVHMEFPPPIGLNLWDQTQQARPAHTHTHQHHMLECQKTTQKKQKIHCHS